MKKEKKRKQKTEIIKWLHSMASECVIMSRWHACQMSVASDDYRSKIQKNIVVISKRTLETMKNKMIANVNSRELETIEILYIFLYFL